MTAVATLEVELPADDYAEQSLAGCALAALEAAESAMTIVVETDFRDHRCWRVIAACARIGHLRDLDDRIAYAAHVANVEPAVLRSWHERRTVFADVNGALARRVADAASRRHEVLSLVAGLEELGARSLGIAA